MHIGREVRARHAGSRSRSVGCATATPSTGPSTFWQLTGTVYQHKLWLGQVLEASDFRETAATPVLGLRDLVGQVHRCHLQLPDGANVSLYSDPTNEAQGLAAGTRRLQSR